MLYLNDELIPVTMFPDKTTQVWKLDPELPEHEQYVSVRWTFCNEGEFLQLAQLKDLLDSQNFITSLTLDYLPYGRQDKEISNNTTFALHTFAKLLNVLNFEEVIIHDPHSEVALDLIHNSRAVYPVKLLEDIAQSLNGDVLLCYPDKGALTKYSKEYKTLYRPYIYGEKVRDRLTGNILSYKVVGECKDKDVLIVDDIVDGGATFALLARYLKYAGAREVNLFATHGIFSKGTEVLFDSGIKRIFTKDGECFEETGAH